MITKTGTITVTEKGIRVDGFCFEYGSPYLDIKEFIEKKVEEFMALPVVSFENNEKEGNQDAGKSTPR